MRLLWVSYKTSVKGLGQSKCPIKKSYYYCSRRKGLGEGLASRPWPGMRGASREGAKGWKCAGVRGHPIWVSP